MYIYNKYVNTYIYTHLNISIYPSIWETICIYMWNYMCMQTCYQWNKTDLLGNAWCQYCMGKQQMLIQHQPGILLAPHLPLGDDSDRVFYQQHVFANSTHGSKNTGPRPAKEFIFTVHLSSIAVYAATNQFVQCAASMCRMYAGLIWPGFLFWDMFPKSRSGLRICVPQNQSIESKFTGVRQGVHHLVGQ